ncbi:MAG TPA: DegQ family serine endoprotease [Rhodanobacteraceae bacterium]|nr:DegQ family serine endoprotease [Rhodanobacteraceae bacterium]
MSSALARRLALLVPLLPLLAALPPPAAATLPAQVAGEPLPSLAPMLEKVTPAVVNIASRTHVRVRSPYFDDPIFRQFFGLPAVPRERVEQALGSGVIVDADKGYVLTNNHVVAGADDITVTLPDKRSVKATVIGTDPATDIAVLKIPADNLHALPLADSSKLRVGDFVVAVGDPFGLGQTVTSGIVSALQRKGLGHGYQNFIQTDASINPGNSGGALVDLHGRLVGINSMIYTPSGGNVGIGFAIPSNLAIRVMHQLVRYGSVRRGTLALQAQDLTPGMARALGMPANRGAIVTALADNSPAAAAGVHVGDVIVALNGSPISSAEGLSNAEGLLPLGKPVTLTLQRKDQRLTVSTHLLADVRQQARGQSLDPRLAGATLADPSAAQKASGLSGVLVESVDDGSRAARNGLRQGDVIIAIGQQRVAGLKRLRAALAETPRQLLLTVARGQQAFYLLMQ